MATDFLVKLLALLLPTQVGFHFWPYFSRVSGIKVDYLSPTLYASYLVLICLVLLNTSKIKTHYQKNKKSYLLFCLLIAVNTLFSQSLPNTQVRWVEILLLASTYIVLKDYKNLWKAIRSPFLFSTFLVVFLQFLQILNQSSLQGLFYYLGERSFSTTTPGISKLNFLGTQVLRAPSIFSHPNSLAGYLLLSLGLLSLKKESLKVRSLPFLSLIFTGSKSGIASLPFLFIKKINLKFFTYSLLVLSCLLPFAKLSSTNILSVDSRMDGYQQSGLVIKENFFFGTGLGNYVLALGDNLPGSQTTSYNLQPVHNIFLLFISELGVLGILIFVLLVKNVQISKPLQFLLVLISLTAFFDHYWLTLLQNKLLLTIAFCLYPLQYKHEELSKSNNKH